MENLTEIYRNVFIYILFNADDNIHLECVVALHSFVIFHQKYFAVVAVDNGGVFWFLLASLKIEGFIRAKCER